MAASLRVLTEPGTPPENEDALGHIEVGDALIAWVLDGATSVSDEDLLGAEVGDVAWYASAMSQALAAAADPEAPPGAIVSAAVARVRADYLARLGGRPAADHERPIAAMVWSRVRPLAGGLIEIEAARLGDCAVFLEAGGIVRPLTGQHDPAAERDMHALVGAQRAGGLKDEAAVRAANLALLRRQRAYLNRPGMRVLGLDETVGERLILERAHAPGGSSLLLMSDGFYRGVEIYGQWTDESLVRDCRQDGLESVLRRLRAGENEETSLDRFPRLKRRDDASAILIEM